MQIDNINPRDHGVLAWKESELEFSKAEIYNSMRKIREVVANRPKLMEELSAYRKYVPVLLKWADMVMEVNDSYSQTFRRYKTDSEGKKYQRWTEEEDELLVELACGSQSMLELSTMIGRTPSAIKTRLTKLVGLKRLSQEIAGKFVGTINSEHIEGIIHGTVQKG